MHRCCHKFLAHFVDVDKHWAFSLFMVGVCDTFTPLAKDKMRVVREDMMNHYDSVEFEDGLFDTACSVLNAMRERQMNPNESGFYLSTNLSRYSDVQFLLELEKTTPWLRVQEGTHGSEYGLYVNSSLGDVRNAWGLVRYLTDLELLEPRLVEHTYDSINDDIDVPFIGNIVGFDAPQKFFVNYGISAFMGEVAEPFLVMKNDFDSPFRIPVVFKDGIADDNVLPNVVEIPYSYLLNMGTSDFAIDLTSPDTTIIRDDNDITWYCPYSGLPHPKNHQFDLALATIKACVETEQRTYNKYTE